MIVTAVAVTAGVGFLPSDGPPASAAPRSADTDEVTLSAGEDPLVTHPLPSATPESDPLGVPSDSGSGRRVVFDQSEQRVWLVRASGAVARTYLVSGSVTDNLAPGTYSVYSRSRWAVGIDDSGVMQYFVRFTEGDNAAIGFHSIPSKNGEPLQTKAQLGTPQSHGCIRQDLPDAIALWEFAPEGTPVVVTP